MSNTSQICTVFQTLTTLEDEVKILNPTVLEGLENFVYYVITEIEAQEEPSFDDVSVEDFNKLSVNLFDSGLVVSIVEANSFDAGISIGFSIIDTWDEADEDTSVEVDLTINTDTGDVVLSARIESEHDEYVESYVTLGSVINILGIKEEDVNLVLPSSPKEVSMCSLVVKERILYLLGESFIQFGTRWRKMLDPDTFQVPEDSVEVTMPEFPGEATMLLLGMLFVAESYRIEEVVQDSIHPPDEDEDEEQESGFGFFTNEPDPRPTEEIMQEAIQQAANNKTLH